MAKPEAVFSSELRSDLEYVFGKDIFVYLIHNQIRTGKKPFDFLFLHKEKFYAIECKLIKGNSINIRNDIKSHQPEFLRKVIHCGGIGLFCVGFKKYKKAFLYTPDSLDYFVEMCKTDAIPFELFEKVCCDHPQRIICIERKKVMKYTRWEVEKIVNS